MVLLFSFSELAELCSIGSDLVVTDAEETSVERESQVFLYAAPGKVGILTSKNRNNIFIYYNNNIVMHVEI